MMIDYVVSSVYSITMVDLTKLRQQQQNPLKCEICDHTTLLERLGVPT